MDGKHCAFAKSIWSPQSVKQILIFSPNPQFLGSFFFSSCWVYYSIAASFMVLGVDWLNFILDFLVAFQPNTTQHPAQQCSCDKVADPVGEFWPLKTSSMLWTNFSLNPNRRILGNCTFVLDCSFPGDSPTSNRVPVAFLQGGQNAKCYTVGVWAPV